MTKRNWKNGNRPRALPNRWRSGAGLSWEHWLARRMWPLRIDSGSVGPRCSCGESVSGSRALDQVWEIAPGRGRKPHYDQAKRDAIIKATLQTKPKGMTHWSCRVMAEEQKVSKNTVNRLWQMHNIKPHLSRTFKLSRDAKFLEKLTDVVGLYLNPPQKAVVLCLDEKSQIQALDRTQPGLPLKKGRCGTMTHDYKRNGTTTLFAALNMLDGKVIGQCHAAASPSGVAEISAPVGPGISPGAGVAFGHGQLRHAQRTAECERGWTSIGGLSATSYRPVPVG